MRKKARRYSSFAKPKMTKNYFFLLKKLTDNLAMKQTSTITPTAKIVSPNARVHLRVSIIGVCKNSELLAYQYLYLTEAHVCIKPTGNKLKVTIANRPKLIDQKEYLKGFSLHTISGLIALNVNNIKPIQSIPETPNKAACP
jgi:hypothetical protein